MNQETNISEATESKPRQAPYFLGCPMWGNPEWKQSFFARGVRPAQFLSQYSSVFNSVEGNTTFYGLPSESTVKRWRDEAADGFSFCFKFPQRITHGQKLLNAEAETEKFLTAMEPIGEHLGPFLLQLGPEFSPAYLKSLDRFLGALPNQFKYTVEVRHTDFFHDKAADDELSELLKSYKADRVIFDTRPLFSARPHTEAVREAQKKKPRVPATSYALGQHPTLRFIGHQDGERSKEYFAPWLRKVAGWIVEGRQPYVFIHTPDNADAPNLAQDFHHGLQALIKGLDDLPDFPIVREASREQSRQQRSETGEPQLDLF